MNFLAHLRLAGNSDEARVGQVLADFVRAPSVSSLAPGIQAGIRAHQRIDAFADAHPAFATARRRLRPPYRRYAGVLLDVYFDHFLALGWERHGDGSGLASFAESCYATLQRFRNLPVPRFARAVDAMQQENWLVGYAEITGVERALQGIARRCRRENPLASGAGVLLEHYECLRADFERVFPPLTAFASSIASAGVGGPHERRIPTAAMAGCPLSGGQS